MTPVQDREQSSSAPTTVAPGARIVVHVAGAVVRPGVVELRLGARGIDALEGAGGARPDADLDRLNLAAKLVDGQQILVARVGEPSSAPGSAPPGANVPPGEPSAPLNLNTATIDQLEALPGIGPTLAQAIVDERERRGAFRSINELRSVRGIGDGRFADLRPRVAV